MARDYLTLGPTPAEEPCEGIGGDALKATRESHAYKRQLMRLFPNSQFGVKSFPHDFGSYTEVVVYFNDENEEEIAEAIRIENNTPERWDDEARQELGLQVS